MRSVWGGLCASSDVRRLVGDAKTRMWSAVDMFSIVFEQREASAKYGISTELVHLPGGCARSIKLGLVGERDADIAEMCRSIENAGAAGLRGICWHFCVLENQRSEATPGRGGTLNSSLYAADYDNDEICEAAQLNGGYITRDEVFERISYRGAASAGHAGDY